MAESRLKPKDLGIAVGILVIAAAIVFASTQVFGGEAQGEPKVIGTADKGPSDGSVSEDSKPQSTAD